MVMLAGTDHFLGLLVHLTGVVVYRVWDGEGLILLLELSHHSWHTHAALVQ